MTNGDLFSLFRQRFPNLRPVDMRPLDPTCVIGRVGLTIWLDNGDIILWFPQIGEEKTEVET